MFQYFLKFPSSKHEGNLAVDDEVEPSILQTFDSKSFMTRAGTNPKSHILSL